MEHPEIKDKIAARTWKKHQFRKQYKRRVRQAAKQGAKAAGKTTAATGRAVAGFVKRHPIGCLIALAVLLIVFMFQSCVSSLVTLGNGMVGSVQVSTYPCEDRELLGAEAAYAGIEAELQNYLDTFECTHDYDEYHFNLDGIEDDPYNLLSILCALHEDGWTVDEIQDTLQMLFDRQYILTECVEVETHYDSDDEPYDWYVCYVTLENTDLSRLPISIMGEEQLFRYALYIAMLGNRPDLFPCSGYVDKYTNPPRSMTFPRRRWRMKHSRP